MSTLDLAWWADRAPQLLAVVVAATAAAGAAHLLRRWLEGIEAERRADAERLRAERLSVHGTAPAVTERRLPLWVVALPWVALLGGALAALDVLEIVVLDEVVRHLRDAAAYEIVPVGGVVLTPGRIIAVLAILAVAHWVSTWAQQAAGRAIRASGDTRQGVVASVQRLVHYGVMALFGVTALREVGLDLSTLFAAGAVFAVGLGFGLQSLTQNFVSGLILLVERTIKPGDVLLVEGRMVRVSELRIRATIGRSLDDDEVILPNGKLLDGFLVNYSLNSEVVRARAKLGVAYGSDVRHVMSVLQGCARAFPRRVQGRDPVVLLTGFGDSSIDFEVSIWVDDPFQRDAILSELRVALWVALGDAGVAIPFPQVDVHLDRTALEALQHRGPTS